MPVRVMTSHGETDFLFFPISEKERTEQLQASILKETETKLNWIPFL